METRANYVLIGAAALIGAALILIFSAWMTGGEWRTGYRIYDVVFDGPVRGLAEAGEVRFNGIRVGEVKSLRVDELDPARIVARVQVSATTPIRVDSHAELEAVGLTGVTLIQLSPGSRDAPALVPQAGKPPPRISSVRSPLDTIMTRQNAQTLTEILANLRAVSRELAGKDSVIAESARTARDLAAAARAVTALSRETRSDLAGLSNRADRALTTLDTAAGSASTAFDQLAGAASVAENQSLPRMTRAAESVERLSRSVDTVVDELERDPSAFLAGQTRPRVKVPQ
jgi:phospholipid/cholesterol/gamma-HCH transport system substrate-binding protein